MRTYVVLRTTNVTCLAYHSLSLIRSVMRKNFPVNCGPTYGNDTRDCERLIRTGRLSTLGMR